MQDLFLQPYHIPPIKSRKLIYSNCLGWDIWLVPESWVFSDLESVWGKPSVMKMTRTQTARDIKLVVVGNLHHQNTYLNGFKPKKIHQSYTPEKLTWKPKTCFQSCFFFFKGIYSFQIVASNIFETPIWSLNPAEPRRSKVWMVRIVAGGAQGSCAEFLCVVGSDSGWWSWNYCREKNTKLLVDISFTQKYWWLAKIKIRMSKHNGCSFT